MNKWFFYIICFLIGFLLNKYILDGFNIPANKCLDSKLCKGGAQNCCDPTKPTQNCPGINKDSPTLPCPECNGVNCQCEYSVDATTEEYFKTSDSCPIPKNNIAKCFDVLKKLDCRDADNCNTCIGEHQEILRRATCHADDFENYCSESFEKGPNKKITPSDYPGGYLEIKNSYENPVIVWFDKSQQFSDPKIDFNNGFYDSNNTSLYNPDGIKQSYINIYNHNGFLLLPGFSLLLKLNSDNTNIVSGGLWFTSYNVTQCDNNPNANRFEYTIKRWEDGIVNATYNVSYVDGFNSYFTLSDNSVKNENNQKIFPDTLKLPIVNNEQCDGSGLQNLNSDMKQRCNENGGKYTILNAAAISGKNEPLCLSPSKQGDIIRGKNQNAVDNINKTGLYNLPSNSDLVGCDAAAQDNYPYACNCLNAWYTNDSNEKTNPWYISNKLELWSKLINDNCDSAYSWAYKEKVPKNYDDIIFNNSNWCNNIVDDHRDLKTWSLLGQKLVDLNYFENSPILSNIIVNPDSKPIIFIELYDIMEPIS